MSPKLTVVVLTYNYGRFLPYCLDSILGQDFTDFELLILDNGSTDGTPEVVAPYLDDTRVRYTRHAMNMSAGYNWNLGIRSGSGRYFTLISADDFILPGHLGKMIRLLEHNPHCVMAYTPITRVDDNNRLISEPQGLGNSKFSYAGGLDDHLELLATGNYASFSACVYDRHQIGADLVFDVDCLGAGDHEVNIRLAAKYKNFACDAVSSVCYREHAAQHSQNEFYKTPEVLFGHMFLLEQHLDRLSQEQLVSRRAELARQITMYMPSFDYWGLHADERARFQSIVQRVQTGLDAWLESAVAERVSLLLPYQVLQAAAPELMAMLALQSDSDWECIVTHDGSQAQLENIASALQMTAAPWRFRLLYCDSQNYAESLNAAALQASGEFFLALQATQSWPAGYLQRLVALLVTDETADIAALLPPSDADPFAAGVFAYPALFENNPLPGGALYRRHVFRTATRYDPVFSGIDVLWGFWIHAIKRHCKVVIGRDAGLSHQIAATETVPLTLAMMRFANLDQMPLQALDDIFLTVIGSKHVWQTEAKRLLETRRSYATAIALDYVARGAGPVVSSDPASTVAAPAPIPTSGIPYLSWILAQGLSTEALRPWQAKLAQWSKYQEITIIVIQHRSDQALFGRTMRSLLAQSTACHGVVVLSPANDDGTYPGVQWRTFRGSWITEFNMLAQHLQSDWLYLIYAGDSLEPDTLTLVADTTNRYPDLAYIYTDQDCSSPDGGAADPSCKPAINLDLLRSLPYTGRSVAMSRAALLTLGGLDATFGEIAVVDFLFRVIEEYNFGAIAHLDRVLCHADVPLMQWCARADNAQAMQQAVSSHLSRLGLTAQVTTATNGVQRVLYPLHQLPQVSVIIRADGLLQDVQRCVASVLEKTAYLSFELLLVPASEHCLHARDINRYLAQVAAQDGRVRLVDAVGDSAGAAGNAAALQASGEYLLFLGHAAAVLQKEWLDLLVHHAARQEVGLVGCKLINRAKKIVHAGAVAGLNGPVGTVFGGEDMAADGYMARLQADQSYSIVSGDCMMVRKALFEHIGGFDMRYQTAALSAADLCLRIRATGFLVVWTPYPVLLLESSERTGSGAELARIGADENNFYRNWWDIVGTDPAHNSNLSLHGSGFDLAGPSRPSVLLQRPKILVWSPATSDAAALYPFRQLHQAGLLDYTVCSGPLPPLSGLIRQHYAALVVAGSLDSACGQALSVLLKAAPLRVIHVPTAAPAAAEQQAIAAFGSLIDLTVARSAAVASAFRECGQTVQLIDADLTQVNPGAGHAPRSRQSQRRLRLGLYGDLDSAAMLLMLQLFERLGDTVDLVVTAQRFPLPLQRYITEYHQISVFLPTPELPSLVDVVLVPADSRQRAAGRIMSCGAAGVAVIAGQAEGLPAQEAGSTLEKWLEAVQRYASAPSDAGADGAVLRTAVMQRDAQNLRHLEQWRDLLCSGDTSVTQNGMSPDGLG